VAQPLAVSLATRLAMVSSALWVVQFWDLLLKIMPKTERSTAIAPSQAKVDTALVEAAPAASSGRTEQA
jgi:hypothetical protein